jgi:protein-S-isoprenylcysteine O-methyltransferase Ste14
MKLLVKNLVFTIFIPGTVAVYVPLLIAHRRLFSSPVILWIIGSILWIAGSVIYLWTVSDFATSGGGTPLPADPPRKLVVRGLYRYVRNPMYLGVLMIILGWAAVFSDAWLGVYAVGVALLVHWFVVFYEEPRLRQLFGSQYDEYCKKVGRWLPRRMGR